MDNFYLKKVNNSIEDLKSMLKQQVALSKEVLNSDEACLYLGITKNHLFKLTSENQIPHSKPGGRKLFFDRQMLYEWAMGNEVETQTEIDKKAIKHVLSSNYTKTKN